MQDPGNSVVPAVIIGAGRVGQALEKMGGGSDVLLGRGDAFPADAPEGPIFVCTRNNDLDAVIENTPEHRREDLVFMQNGMLQPYLDSKGLGDATQVLVYFAVAKLGEEPTDGLTDTNPEGLTAANGKWAEAACARFNSVGLSCKVPEPEVFKAMMFEKLIWIAAFMLVGAQHPGATVGDVESKFNSEVCRLITELGQAITQAEGVKFADQLPERLCAYARSVAHFPTAVKEFEWRNGYFYGLTKKARDNSLPDPCPLHTAGLEAIAAVP